ncbi:hypothetical protein [Actinotalea sp. K2]|uniref:hypothetical protein n=1 Tax=Actinotalea sp. K2 TaxID=2939438 RepID=UPI0020183691|nr:hypothetical protein [Actinotalea sp. K2]MCL3860561.1 hypothetical protein [Actinotalea sp. K2]
MSDQQEWGERRRRRETERLRALADAEQQQAASSSTSGAGAQAGDPGAPSYPAAPPALPSRPLSRRELRERAEAAASQASPAQEPDPGPRAPVERPTAQRTAPEQATVQRPAMERLTPERPWTDRSQSGVADRAPTEQAARPTSRRALRAPTAPAADRRDAGERLTPGVQPPPVTGGIRRVSPAGNLSSVESVGTPGQASGPAAAAREGDRGGAQHGASHPAARSAVAFSPQARAQAVRAQAARAQAEREQAARENAERAQAQRVDIQRAGAERAEAERLQAERLRVERVQRAQRSAGQRAEPDGDAAGGHDRSARLGGAHPQHPDVRRAEPPVDPRKTWTGRQGTEDRPAAPRGGERPGAAPAIPGQRPAPSEPTDGAGVATPEPAPTSRRFAVPGAPPGGSRPAPGGRSSSAGVRPAASGAAFSTGSPGPTPVAAPAVARPTPGMSSTSGAGVPAATRWDTATGASWMPTAPSATDRTTRDGATGRLQPVVLVPADATPRVGETLGVLSMPDPDPPTPDWPTVEPATTSGPVFPTLPAQRPTQGDHDDEQEVHEDDTSGRRHPYTWFHMLALIVVAFVLGMLIFMLILRDSPPTAAPTDATAAAILALDVTDQRTGD